MAFRLTQDGAILIEGKESVALAAMLTLRVCLGFECKGLRTRGKSALSIVKKQYGLKGSKEKVYDEFLAICEEAKTKH